MAGTAAGSAGSRSRRWGITGPGEQLDWQVIVRLVAHCRRRYRRACDCRVPATVMAPGPPKAIGKGLFTNGFIAMLLRDGPVPVRRGPGPHAGIDGETGQLTGDEDGGPRSLVISSDF